MFVICFISQWMKKSKHGLFIFLPKKTLIWRRHCLIGQSCCSMMSKQSIGWFVESSRAWSFFTQKRSLNQPKATCVCIRLISQSNFSISGHLLFLFFLCVFISRSYKNHCTILSSMSLIRYVHYKLSAELLYFSLSIELM